MADPRTVPEPLDAAAGLVEAKRLVLMGQIAAGASHDLNNLLGKIIGLAEMTMDHVADCPAACAELEALITVAEQGAVLVGRLEACSGRSVAEPRRFDPAPLVYAACAAVRVRRPDLDLVCELPGDLGQVMADEALIRVALDAVLDNACRSGARRIEVSCRTTPADLAEVAVRDDGAGMTPEVLARAFEPFFTTRPSRETMGLGLTLAKAAMLECEGRIEADSPAEGGTVVRLTLPPAGPAGSNGS